jgi:hypothetical protein
VLAGEQRWGTAVVLALIGKALWAILIVTPGKNPNPVGTVACALCSLPDALSPSQQPDDLQVTSFNRIVCFPVTLLELIDAQMSGEMDIFRHDIPFLEEYLFQGEFFIGSKPRGKPP